MLNELFKYIMLSEKEKINNTRNVYKTNDTAQ